MPLTITEEMMKQDPFFQEGLEKGLKEGLEKGIEKGKLEAQREAILNLYRELQLPPEKIAKVPKVSEDFVRKVLSEAKEL